MPIQQACQRMRDTPPAPTAQAPRPRSSKRPTPRPTPAPRHTSAESALVFANDLQRLERKIRQLDNTVRGVHEEMRGVQRAAKSRDEQLHAQLTGFAERATLCESRVEIVECDNENRAIDFASTDTVAAELRRLAEEHGTVMTDLDKRLGDVEHKVGETHAQLFFRYKKYKKKFVDLRDLKQHEARQ